MVIFGSSRTMALLSRWRIVTTIIKSSVTRKLFTTVRNHLSQKLKLIGEGTAMNIMLNTLPHVQPHTCTWRAD
ncbi:hypothetical protein LguiB_002270 [Lonicera macranthoides]